SGRIARRDPRASARRAAPVLRALERLEALAREYGPGLGARKYRLLARLERDALPSAAAIERLHETATFLLAYPDDAGVRRAALPRLRGFAARRDLVRFAAALADSGIAGTAIRFRFFSRMARWLGRRWPDRLAIDWNAFDDPALLETLLPLLAHPAEAPGLDEYDLGLRGWLARMAGRSSDAAFLTRAVGTLPASPVLRDALHDAID